MVGSLNAIAEESDALKSTEKSLLTPIGVADDRLSWRMARGYVMRRMFKVATYCRALGLFVLVVSSNPTESRAQQATGKGYLPHLANLMNEAMQVHHTKLWLAGRANNWALAAYELAKIKETIEEVKE